MTQEQRKQDLNRFYANACQLRTMGHKVREIMDGKFLINESLLMMPENRYWNDGQGQHGIIADGNFIEFIKNYFNRI